MKRVIIDSSSLILLHKCGVIMDLIKFCIPVIPETVFAELTVPCHDGADLFQTLCSCGKIIICGMEESNRRNITATLHAGETDVINLYHESSGDYILIDDRQGGAFCRDNNIPYINALLAIKILFLKGLLTEERFINAWNMLIRIGRYSRSIITWAENAGLENLSGFM